MDLYYNISQVVNHSWMKGMEWPYIYGNQLCSMKIETFTEEDTRYKKHCTQDSNASVPFKVGTLGSHTLLPIAIPLYFPESHQWSEISSPSKVILVLRKAEVTGHQIWDVAGWVTCVIWYFTKKTLHETWCTSGFIVTTKLPVTSCPSLWPSGSSEYFPWRNQ